jgi:hypothetical protein
MPSTTKLQPDTDSSEAIEGIDRHYYANQVVSGGPWDRTYPFRMAAAHAKDRARHHLLKAIWMEEQRLASQTFTGGLALTSGVSIVRADFSQQARANVLANRTVDGVKGASDDAIKL